MAQTVKLKRSAVAGNVPTTSSLELGELAINTIDGRVFFEKSSSAGYEVKHIITSDSQTTGSLELTGDITASNLSLVGFPSVSASLASAVAGGDNLGNHTATQNINVGGFNIYNLAHITASGDISGSSTSTGSFGAVGVGTGSVNGVFVATTEAEWNRTDEYPFQFINTDNQNNQGTGLLVKGGAGHSGTKVFTIQDKDSTVLVDVGGTGNVDIPEGGLGVGVSSITSPFTFEVGGHGWFHAASAYIDIGDRYQDGMRLQWDSVGDRHGIIQTRYGSEHLDTGNITSLLLQPSGGFVGIGVDSPSTDLDISGSINFSNGTAATSLSGSAYSTGSFGRVEATTFSGDGSGLTNVFEGTTPSASISTRLTTAETELGNTLISGSAQIATDISGSWRGELSSSTVTVVGGGVSGSYTSTGSFGKLLGDGSDLTGVTSPAAISGSDDTSWKEGTATLFSGSSASTASFGRVEAHTVEAKRYIVSSSVTNIVTMNISGSTHFGDSADDIHAFTGSVVIPSGSLKGEIYVDTNANKMFVGKFQGGIPVSGSSVSASRYATGSDGSIVDLGYSIFDEDGNESLITTGDGIHVDATNYWYNNKFFKIGSTNRFIEFNPSTNLLKTQGELVPTTGSFEGELYITTGQTGSMFIGKFTGGIPVSGSSVSASRYATGSDGSIVDLGYTTVDEDGNVSLITTGDGIHLDNDNYWYNNKFFKIGDANQYVQWDNTNLNISASATSTGSFGRVSGVSGSLSRLDGGTIGSVNLDGDILPAAHNTSDLGSDSVRFANIYSADVHLSNDETEGNEVDGTTGNWTIQEGNEDLFIINRKTGKKFKFLLQEVT